MNLNEVVIESRRLKLVAINESHIRDVYTNFTQPISRFMFPQPTGQIDDTEKFVKSSMEGLVAGTNLQLVILDIENDEFLGCIGLHNIGTEDPELGVWIKKSAQSEGYGLEGIRELVKWAKANIDYDHFKYPVDKNNTSSRRIPVTLGGKFMKSYKRMNMLKTKELDIVEYWIKK